MKNHMHTRLPHRQSFSRSFSFILLTVAILFGGAFFQAQQSASSVYGQTIPNLITPTPAAKVYLPVISSGGSSAGSDASPTPPVSQAEEEPTPTPDPIIGSDYEWPDELVEPLQQPTPDDVALRAPVPQGTINVPIVYVSRKIPDSGSVYWSVPKSMPGVGPYSRFQLAAPGKLIVREANGTKRVLVDGSNPTTASLNLIDVGAPNVSYDGKKILFAGLPAGTYSPKPLVNLGAWRIYVIHVDGTGLRQLTFSDQNLDLSRFPVSPLLKPYDDADPVWLPDGRIVFSSTRWPSFGPYGAARTTNLYLINADGTGLRRITSERGAADRPQIDPLTGKIVFSRWWRNMRLPTDNMETIVKSTGGYNQYLGLIAANFTNAESQMDKGINLKRNAWQLAVINPDGTGLAQWGGVSGHYLLGEDANHTYGFSFAPDGTIYANFFPMKNMTEASGFGGIRQFKRGAAVYRPVIGVTSEVGYQLANINPNSYGVYKSQFAADPVVLPDGRLLISWAPDHFQDYGLYLVNPDGSNRQLLTDEVGRTELRAQIVAPRSLPPVIADKITQVPSLMPPLEQGPYDIDGTFTFQALNVYFNGPVDSEVVNAIPVGQAGTIRFFTEFQRKQTGSNENLDWPILLAELKINPDGSVINPAAPANLPLFEQIRTPGAEYKVARTGRNLRGDGGAAHVAGLNYGRPGEVSTCVGCHAGHTMLKVPSNPIDAKFTNLATGAAVSFSSTHPNPYLDKTGKGLIDRRVMKGKVTEYWRSDPAQSAANQWVQLTFPVPVSVRTVRLYSPRPVGGYDSISTQVENANVYLYSDVAATQQVGKMSVGKVPTSGVDVRFNDVKVRSVRVYITGVSGTFFNETVASLAEIEVIARAEAAE